MEEKEEILIQLYKILHKIAGDKRIYYRLSEQCKQSFLRNFYMKLSHQKRSFYRRIRYEIKELEKEILLNKENGLKNVPIIGKESFHGLPSFRFDMNTLIKYSIKKEQEYLHIYKTLLSITHLGNIREMLLNQRHAVQLNLNEIRSIENKNDYGKNEEQLNYS